MQKTIVKNVAKVALMAGAFGLAGCASAYIPDTVHNHYKAPASMTKVPGAENVTVTVIVHNHKKRHNEISRSKDMFGIPFAGVYLHIDKAFKTAINNALSKRGFIIGDSGTQVNVIIQHFYMPADMFTSSVSFNGHLDMQVSIPSVGYTKIVDISNMKYQGGFFRGYIGPGRTAAANKFMEEGVNKIVENPQFMAALLKAGHAGAVVPRLPISR